MGKRSAFPRIPKDKYRTPLAAVVPLLPHLPAGTLFDEPCAGNGALIDLLEAAGHRCVWASDTAPERDDIDMADALDLTGNDHIGADMVITNPPWTRSILHPLIDHLSAILPCWFLFDASWPYTKQSADLIRRCSKIVPVGRIKWIPDSPYAGKDDCAWFEFLPGHTTGPRLVPITTKGTSNAAPATKVPLPLVPSGAGVRERQDAPDAGSPPDTEVAGRHQNGTVLPGLQSHQGRYAGSGVDRVHGSSSEMVAKLRSKLRFVVSQRIGADDVDEGTE